MILFDLVGSYLPVFRTIPARFHDLREPFEDLLKKAQKKKKSYEYRRLENMGVKTLALVDFKGKFGFSGGFV